MVKENAEEYYFFKEDFYPCSIFDNMKDTCEIFYAVYEGKKIAMSMMLHENDRMLIISRVLFGNIAIWHHRIFCCTKQQNGVAP